MNIKEALQEAIALLDGVRVEPGLTNMKRHIVGVERIQAVVRAIEKAEKEEAQHANDYDKKREDAGNQVGAGAAE